MPAATTRITDTRFSGPTSMPLEGIALYDEGDYLIDQFLGVCLQRGRTGGVRQVLAHRSDLHA